MFTKTDYLSLKAKVRRAKDILDALTFMPDKGSDLWSVWNEYREDFERYEKYLALTPQQKARLLEAWKNYYRSVWDSVEGRRFKACGEALKSGNKSEAIRLGHEARQALIEGNYDNSDKPSSIDPLYLEQRMGFVNKCKRIIEIGESTLDKYSGEFEKGGRGVI